MKKIPKRFYIVAGYGGSVKACVVIGEENIGKTWGEIEEIKKMKNYIAPKSYIIDLVDIEKIVMDLIDKNGYTITQTKRQKYPRLKINS